MEVLRALDFLQGLRSTKVIAERFQSFFSLFYHRDLFQTKTLDFTINPWRTIKPFKCITRYVFSGNTNEKIFHRFQSVFTSVDSFGDIIYLSSASAKPCQSANGKLNTVLLSRPLGLV